ncbi:hypothetical protein [Novipirellula caenicola]|uniref:Secreted protein n=1 Tax=Novipirellula caenicola TaxID=1536901 RepID=A0ABP9VXH1_9BACT
MNPLKSFLLLMICSVSMFIAGCGTSGPPTMVEPDKTAEEMQAISDEKEKAELNEVPY